MRGRMMKSESGGGELQESKRKRGDGGRVEKNEGMRWCMQRGGWEKKNEEKGGRGVSKREGGREEE